ncbi:hypothetical protein [Streptomyces mirabilis]|uniref:hypothetical protein n=1 Tax=Streptomyces mirabilis TaxID=68239 RepID=UPI0033F3E821
MSNAWFTTLRYGSPDLVAAWVRLPVDAFGVHFDGGVDEGLWREGAGVSLDKPGHRPARNGLKILNRLRERGYKLLASAVAQGLPATSLDIYETA